MDMEKKTYRKIKELKNSLDIPKDNRVNNFKLKHIFCIISLILLRNHWSCLDMWSEIDFVKGKLDAIEYQMIHGELLPFIIKTEDKKNNVSTRQCSYLYSHYEKVISRFRNHYHGYWVLIWTWWRTCGKRAKILARKVYYQKKSPIENIVKFEGKIKTAWTDI